jgi:hypothetical protein
LRGPPLRNHELVEDVEATRITLEALFDSRAAVYEIHDAILGGEDEAEEEDS